MTNPPFSAVVVCYNEAHLLDRCLASLDFCEEFILVDLGSTDNSLAKAQAAHAKILTYERGDYPNLARQFGIRHANHEWVISIDPDEVFPKDGVEVIAAVLRRQSELTGIRLPWQFYFRGRELHTTVWARTGVSKCVVVHRDRIEGTPYVHQEFKDGPSVYRFPAGSIQPIQHYWVNSYAELYEKHRRYVGNEGEKMYVNGQRFAWFSAGMATLRALKANLVDYRGLRGGIDGVGLSFFYAGYVFASWMALRAYQRRLNGLGTASTMGYREGGETHPQ